MTKLSFHITEEEYAALEELSERESRFPAGLVARFVRQGLQREGLMRDYTRPFQRQPEYTAVETDLLEALIEKVNTLVSDGWQPLGGVSLCTWVQPERRIGDLVSGPMTRVIYVQAMVKQ